MIGDRKEWRAGKTVRGGSETKIALAARSCFTNSHDCLSGSERGSTMNTARRRGNGHTEIDVLRFLHQSHGPRGERQIMLIIGNDRSDAEQHIGGGNDRVKVLEIGQRVVARFAVEIFRQRLSRDPQSLNLVSCFREFLFGPLQKLY